MNNNPPQLPGNGTAVFQPLLGIRALKYSVLVAGTIFLIVLDYKSLTGAFPIAYAILYCGISVIAMPLIIMAFAETGMKITLDAHSLRQTTFFTKDEVLLTEIRGWKKEKDVLYIFPSGYALKPMSIPMGGMVPKGLAERLMVQYQEVSEDSRFIEGARPEQVKQRLRRAKTEVYGLGAITLVLALLTINSAGASTRLPLLLLSCVPLSLLLLLRHKAFIQLCFEKETGGPSVLFILVIVLLAFSYVNSDFYLVDEWELRPYTIVTFFILLGLQLVCYRKMRSAMRYLVATILTGSLFFAIASQGVKYCNRALDGIPPQHFQASIIARFHKERTRIEDAGYYFKLDVRSDVGRVVSVPESLYNSKSAGDDVEVYWHMGAFGAPWFTIGE